MCIRDRFHGLLSRNCNAILALLKRELIKQTDNFEAGIMPLTYSQLSVCPAAPVSYTHLDVYKRQVHTFLESPIRRVIDRCQTAADNHDGLEQQDVLSLIHI